VSSAFALWFDPFDACKGGCTGAVLCYALFMVWTVDAIYDGGVLRPLGSLPFRDHERVRVTVEPIAGGTNGCSPRPEGGDRAMQDLLAKLAASRFRSTGPYPSRDELHER
jgi:predicted DNA-binding antitoxin AbrB/MazE fold protein